MDLIFTNAKREDLGLLSTHYFDLSYGAQENDFELTLGAEYPMLESDACVTLKARNTAVWLAVSNQAQTGKQSHTRAELGTAF